MKLRFTTILATAMTLVVLSGAWAGSASAAPNWIVGGQFLRLNAERANFKITGELTFGTFNFGGHMTSFKCKTTFREKLFGGSVTVNGTDEVTSAIELDPCTVQKPEKCTITGAKVIEPGSKPFGTELVASGGSIYHKVKNIEFREVTFAGAECVLVGDKFRGNVKSYLYKTFNAGVRVGLELAGEEDEFVNEATETEASKGDISGTEEMEAPESETLAVGEETASEGEFVNKTGNALSKDRFSATSGETKLETTGGTAIKCKADTATGVMTSKTAGEETILFTGCTASGLSCKGGKDASGEAPAGSIYVLAGIAIRKKVGRTEDLLLLSVRKPGSKEAGELEVVCAGVKIKIKGSFLSSPVALKTFKTSWSFATKQAKGVQEPAKYENEKGEEVKDSLEASIEGKAFEAAGEEGKENAVFEEEGQFL